MFGPVWMPFATGGFAVVMPDGEIVTEGLTKEQAKAEVRLIERKALAGPRAAGDAETRLQAG